VSPWRRRAGTLAGLAFVATMAVVYSASLLFSHPGQMAAADSHYHFAVAREIWRGALVPDVSSGLPWTVLHDMPVDHYWGYHVLVAPFAARASAEAGMKTAACAMFALVFVSLYLFLRSRRVPFAWAWAVLPAMFSTQDWRYLQLRGGQLLVPLLFLLVHAAFFEERRNVRRAALVVVAYVGMLSYHAAVLLLPLHVAGMLARSWWARARGVDDSGRPMEVLFTALGLALGLTLNPYMDARASTWRFAAYHVAHMGNDSAGLYDDLEISEFHGFPFRVMRLHPEWGVVFVVVLAAVAWVAWSVARKRAIEADVVVVAALALLGVALTAKAMRLREYSVPLGFALVALLSRPRAAMPWWSGITLTPLLAALVPFGLVHHWERTWLTLDAHLPTDQFAGAGRLLDANGARPILNVAEADYCMLKWQKTDVVCVQGLSRYFLYPDRALYADVWTLHDRAETAPDTPEILGRFFDRGVRLVTTHKTHALARWAEGHPEVLVPRFASHSGKWVIWQINPSGIGRPSLEGMAPNLLK
jgi:hypothetical protein